MEVVANLPDPGGEVHLYTLNIQTRKPADKKHSSEKPSNIYSFPSQLTDADTLLKIP